MVFDDDKILQQFGNRLKELRKAKGFSNYEQFAYTYNINRVQYGRYEKGCNISLKTLVKILSFHDMTITDFFSAGFD
jgi:transcriptional regulator with XRE-family HTH domain